jgi:DNA-directed RNA polymerase sigma subunit (sigma70/sigma32)
MMRLRLGLTDGRTHTSADVVDAFGISRERMRQVEVKFLAFLGHSFSGSG